MQLFSGKGHLRSLILEQMVSEKLQKVPEADEVLPCCWQVYHGQKRRTYLAFPWQHFGAKPAHLDFPSAHRCAPGLPTELLLSVSLPIATAFEVM